MKRRYRWTFQITTTQHCGMLLALNISVRSANWMDTKKSNTQFLISQILVLVQFGRFFFYKELGSLTFLSSQTELFSYIETFRTTWCLKQVYTYLPIQFIKLLWTCYVVQRISPFFLSLLENSKSLNFNVWFKEEKKKNIVYSVRYMLINSQIDGFCLCIRLFSV